MNITIRQFLASALIGLALAVPAHADDAKADFGARASLGYQYDSNVSLTELDTNTGEADYASLAEIGLDASLPVSQDLSLKLGYGFTQTRYQDFSEFDTAIHRFQVDGQYRVGGFDTGLALRHFGARLDNERFLDIRQVSPSIARMIGKTFYVRGAYTSAEKTYADREERDATGSALDFDVYVLLDGMQRYLSFGINVNDEDATDPELDYDGNKVRLAYGHKFEKLQLKARLQFDERDYANVTESIGEQRRDSKFRAGLDANFSLTDMFEIVGEAQYVDTESNLETANFDEMVYSLSLAAKF